MRLPLPRLTYANVVSTAALIAVLGGGAIAVSVAQTSAQEIAVCVKSRGAGKGTVRVLSKPTTACKKTERKLRWNSRGPAGPQGLAGATGPAGRDATASGSGGTPAGMVAFFDAASCPSGWSEHAAARGRYVVGLNPGGALGGTGGSPLGDREDRAAGQHGHTIQDPGHSHAVWQVGYRLRVPGTNSLAGNTGFPQTLLPPAEGDNAVRNPIQLGTTGITVNPNSAPAGTNAPYVQLLACRKD